MRHLAGILAIALAASGCSSTVTVVHFTDYHSHAASFYVHGDRDAAGIARAYAYIEPFSRRDDVIVLNGGDTMNRGAPPWSDKFRCVEWPWWNGIVDAMAYGNHDADYGPGEFVRCQAEIDYPILGANVMDATGAPLFDHEGLPYLVMERSGRRIGVFAVVGSDFPALMKRATSPVEDVSFTDRIESAREVVRALREKERVDAIILFGHGHNEEDEALAHAVPGIDLILGTHSHKTSPLKPIAGTNSWMIASGQYLENIANVEIEFRGRRIARMKGNLVRMDAARARDPRISERVAALQADLESDPRWASLFRPFGNLDESLSNDDVNTKATALGSFVMEAVRQASGADIAISTSSSFRGGLPAGRVSEADLLEVLPYENAVLVYEMTSAELDAVLERARGLRGTDSFVQLSGASVDQITDGGKTWLVATTDYLAHVSPQWKDLFEGRTPRETGLGVRAIVRDVIGR